MMIQSRQRLDVLQLVLGLKNAGRATDEAETPRLRPQPNAFSDLLNAQYAQAASVLPRPIQKTRAAAKPPAKRASPQKEHREHPPGRQRLSAWA